MKRMIFQYLFAILFFSCTSAKNVLPANPSIETNDGGTILKIDNPTRYNVYFDGGQSVNKNSNGTIKLYIEEGTLSRGFDILYEIPLSDTVPLYCKGDHRTFRENQSSFIITEPHITENYGIYIKIKNKVNNAISFYNGTTVNPSWEQQGNPKDGNYLNRTDKREFSPGETAVFDINSDLVYNNYFIRDSSKNIPLVLPQNVKKNYIYSFEYSTDGVELTDSRSLHRIGENSWVKTIDNADCLMPFVSKDGEISLFASINRANKNYKKGINRIVYLSDGNDKNTKTIPSGDGFNITYTSSVNDGFFVVGYKEEGRNKNKPQARVIGADGVLRRALSESADYESARYLSVAQKNDTNTWFLAGDGMKNGYYGYTAYARLVRDEDNKFTVVKEWGENDFPQYKNIKVVAYNNKLECWLITGEMKSPLSGFYLACINNDGTIQKIFEFQEMEFYKILVDTNGNYYLAGQEKKGNDTYAVLNKYGIDNKRIWQASKIPPSHSYYYDAIFNNDNNCIVLAGTLQATDEYGTGGKQFIESVDITNGTRLWHEILSDFDFNGMNLVTAIASVPDYGYILSLSGIKEGLISKSFKIARINSQGKLFKYSY
jgi:hypothetical protein